MKVFKSLTATLLMASCSLSFASVYVPFEFHDKILNKREDITNILPKLRVEISPIEAAGLKKVSIADIDLYLFKEVADFMELANNPSHTTRSTLPAPQKCKAHSLFDITTLTKVRNSCPFIKHTFNKAREEQNLFLNCQNAYQPELYVDEIPAGEVKIGKLNDLPGLIQTIAWPLVYVKLSDNLVTPQMLTKMRFLLTKIRMSDLLEKVSANKELYATLLKDLEFQKCFKTNDQEINKLKADLLALTTEIKNAENYLSQIDQEGRRLAEIDHQKVLLAGKVRSELPYPNLTDADREYITMYISALMWRYRGGGVVERSDSTQFRRIFYNWFPMNILGALNGGDYGDQKGGALFVGLFKMWGQYFDMGQNPAEQDRFFDITKMSERGIFQTKLLIKTLERDGFSSLPVKMASIQMGPVYYYATYSNLVSANDYRGNSTPPFAEFIGGPTDWGEILFGATIGLGLSRSLLGGQDPMVQSKLEAKQ